MLARSYSSIAMLLVTGPLAAIPLMAVCGIPQFAPVAASTALTELSTEDVLRQPAPHTTVQGGPFGSSARVGQALVPGPANEATRSPKGRPSSATAASASRGFSNSVGDYRAANDLAQTPGSHDLHSPIASIVPAIENPPSDAARSSGPTAFFENQSITMDGSSLADDTDLSWQNAAQRLRAIGIDDYRLERGLRSDSFLFICQFVSGTDGRIVQRFEAEADKPIDAVRQVCSQIDHWQHWTRPPQPK